MGRTACKEHQCLYSTAIPLLPLWAVRPVQSLSACTVQPYLYSPYGPYGLYRASVPVQYSYTSTPPMGRTACTEPQCLYSIAIPLLPLWAVGLYRASVLVQGCTFPIPCQKDSVPCSSLGHKVPARARPNHTSSHYICQPIIFKCIPKKCEKRLLDSSFLFFRLPVHMEHLGSHEAEFHEIWYLSIFRKYVVKIQVSLKSDKNNGFCTWRPIYINDNFFSCGAAAQRGPWPPHSWGF